MIRFIGRLSRVGVRMSFGLLPETLVSFLIVGSLGVLVHLSILNIAMRVITQEFKYANLMAMLVAATFNFFMNNESTFREKSLVGRHVLLGYLFYLGITGLGMIMSLFISTHIYAQNRIPMVAALGGIVVGSLWNYLMSYTFVWKLLSNFSGRRK